MVLEDKVVVGLGMGLHQVGLGTGLLLDTGQNQEGLGMSLGMGLHQVGLGMELCLEEEVGTGLEQQGYQDMAWLLGTVAEVVRPLPLSEVGVVERQLK